MRKVVVGIVLVVLGGLVAVGAGWAAVRQDLENRRWVAVEGVKESAAGASAVRYAYEVGGKRYEGTRVVPAYGDDDADWTGWYRKKAAGTGVTVWVDRADAGNSVLVKEVMTGPYWAALLGAGIAAIGLMNATGGLEEGSQEEKRAGAAEGGWVEILPRRRWGEKVRGTVSGAAVFGTGAVLCGVYYGVRSWPYDWRGCALLAACVAAAVWQWVRVRRVWMVAGALGDPRVWVPAGGIVRGEKFGVKVEVAAKRAMKWVSVFVEVVCVEHSWASSGPGNYYDRDRDVWRSEHVQVSRARVKAGEVVAGSGELVAAAEQAASGKSLKKQDKDGWPYCVWEVRVSGWVGGVYGEEAYVVRVG
ncbi:MAG TPA: DUF3592 domain-containing protein [Phycisphaerae bacterium]|nr:DUF3592 domain-containing protein [Phycisphaerae bacterium]